MSYVTYPRVVCLTPEQYGTIRPFMEARMLTHKQVAEVLGIPKAAFSRAVYTIHRFGMDAFKQKHVVEKLS